MNEQLIRMLVVHHEEATQRWLDDRAAPVWPLGQEGSNRARMDTYWVLLFTLAPSHSRDPFLGWRKAQPSK